MHPGKQRMRSCRTGSQLIPASTGESSDTERQHDENTKVHYAALSEHLDAQQRTGEYLLRRDVETGCDKPATDTRI